MKNVILASVLALISSSVAFGQTEKHSFMVGGTGTYSSTMEGSIHNTVIDFSPRVGYFALKNLAVGINLSLNKTVDDGEEYSTTLYCPFVRYYFLSSSNDNLKLFGNANAFLGKEDEGVGSSTLTGFGAAVGANYFFTKHVCFETSFGYSSTHAQIESVKDNTFGFNIGFQIFLFKKDNK
jgi:hypothetical protein